MQIEKQVCSLELAKQLKELGVEQESLFYWIKIPGYPAFLQNSREPQSSVWVEGTEIISAFTVVELGEMLPEGISTSKNIQGIWEVYDNETYKPVVMDFVAKADTEANARALMLIHLIKNNLIQL